MKHCCYSLQSVGIDCRCEDQRRPATFTAEEISKYITPTHNN